MPLLCSLPSQLIQQIFYGRWKLARATATFMRRVHAWVTNPVFQPLVDFIAKHCKNLFQDSLIEHINSLVTRMLKQGKKLTAEQVKEVVHSLKPTVETRQKQQGVLGLRTHQAEQGELDRLEHQVTTLGKNDFYRQIIPEWVVGQFCFALSSSQNGERPVNIERMVLKNQMQTKGGKRWGIDPFLDAQAEYFKYKPPKDPRSKKAMVNDVFKLVLDNKIIFTNYGSQSLPIQVNFIHEALCN